MGVAIPVLALDQDEIAAKYVKLEACGGYCKDVVMRKVAILCALDSAEIKGRGGSEIFPEFAMDGVRTSSPIKKGRGITIADGI